MIDRSEFKDAAPHHRGASNFRMNGGDLVVVSGGLRGGLYFASEDAHQKWTSRVPQIRKPCVGIIVRTSGPKPLRLGFSHGGFAYLSDTAPYRVFVNRTSAAIWLAWIAAKGYGDPVADEAMPVYPEDVAA